MTSGREESLLGWVKTEDVISLKTLWCSSMNNVAVCRFRRARHHHLRKELSRCVSLKRMLMIAHLHRPFITVLVAV